MKHIFAIAGRELRSIFGTPVAYIVIATYMLFAGFIFFGSLGQFILQIQQIQAMGLTQYLDQWNLNQIVIAPAYGTFALIFAMLIPLLSARALAGERANGSIELLLTAPITSWEIIIGKYLAVLTVVTVIVALTGMFPMLLFWYGNPEVMQTLSGLLTLFLYGAGLAALCCFISALTDSLLVAAFVGIVVSLLLLVLPFAAESTSNEGFKAALNWLGSSTHFEQGLQGQVRTEDLTYFGVMVVVFLSLARLAAESLRWR